MRNRSIILTGIAVFLLCCLGPGTALASVKCQCNNGSTTFAMSADYDDDDVEESCNDACSISGGGRVWRVDSDDDDSGDVTLRPGERRRENRPAAPRRR